MLKLLIADDEFLIRDGLARNVDWHCLGYEVIGTAEHGAMALELISKEVPDVVLTDIRMPFMDGFELIKSINDTYPDTCVVFISGHEEFEYAKRALQENVFDYLLKPINIEDLEKTMARLKDHIELKQSKAQEFSSIKNTIKHATPLLRERFIKDIINRKLNESEILHESPRHEFPADKMYIAALIQIDDYFAENAQSIFDQQRQLEIYFDIMNAEQPNTILVNMSINDYILLLYDDTQDSLNIKLEETMEMIMEQAKSHFLSLTIAAGTPVKGLQMLPESFSSAMKALNIKFLRGGNRILRFHELKDSNLAGGFEGYDLKAFFHLIRLSGKDEILNSFHEIRKDLLQKELAGKVVIQVICSNILFEVNQIVEELGVRLDEIIPHPNQFYQKLISQPTAEAMFDMLESMITAVIDYRDAIRFGKFSPDIEKAKNYIEENYADITLNLKTLARHVNMGACYFSVVFKKEAGVTFIDYLTKIRIDKSKELLLSSNMKTYEISYKVGYDNPTYFSTLFKKLCGQSPSEFRKQNMTQ